jgi:hypothetical protein
MQNIHIFQFDFEFSKKKKNILPTHAHVTWVVGVETKNILSLAQSALDLIGRVFAHIE